MKVKSVLAPVFSTRFACFNPSYVLVTGNDLQRLCVLLLLRALQLVSDIERDQNEEESHQLYQLGGLMRTKSSLPHHPY